MPQKNKHIYNIYGVNPSATALEKPPNKLCHFRRCRRRLVKIIYSRFMRSAIPSAIYLRMYVR